MQKVECEVVKDDLDEHFRMFCIQWWVLMNKRVKMIKNYMKIVGRKNANAI
jgi:hypothetical protein